jgi:hypothetical protein
VSGPWPSGAGQGLLERYGSGGLGRVCSVRVGFGDAAEGDLEAEGSELAGMMGDLAAGGADTDTQRAIPGSKPSQGSCTFRMPRRSSGRRSAMGPLDDS